MRKRFVVLVMMIMTCMTVAACGQSKKNTSNSNTDENTEAQKIESEQDDSEVVNQDENDDKADGSELETPINWGEANGPEEAVKNYYANTAFELVSVEATTKSKEHVIFEVVCKKDGQIVDPNRSIELKYENDMWNVVNEGY